MNLESRINALSDLGRRILSVIEPSSANSDSDSLQVAIQKAGEQNPWFIPQSVAQALGYWASALTSENLRHWTNQYPRLSHHVNPSKILIIMAGNIPLAGFHDLLCVLICGHHALIKTSSRDSILIRSLADQLLMIEPGFEPLLSFDDPANFSPDAVIASGTNLTATTLNNLYSHLPRIIRHHRTSAAFLSGIESSHEIWALCRDILDYSGLGCRNVSWVAYVGEPVIIKLKEELSSIPDSNVTPQLIENRRFQKARMELSRQPHSEAGPLIICTSPHLHPPIGVLNIFQVDSWNHFNDHLHDYRHEIQCVAGRAEFPGTVAFGKTQSPELNDYADQVDTISFLTNLHPNGS